MKVAPGRSNSWCRAADGFLGSNSLNELSWMTYLLLETASTTWKRNKKIMNHLPDREQERQRRISFLSLFFCWERAAESLRDWRLISRICIQRGPQNGVRTPTGQAERLTWTDWARESTRAPYIRLKGHNGALKVVTSRVWRQPMAVAVLCDAGTRCHPIAVQISSDVTNLAAINGVRSRVTAEVVT